MRIVDPTFGLPVTADHPAEDAAADAKPTDWQQDPIVLFSNSKPNTRELLEGLRQQFGSFRSTDTIGFVQKDGAGQPAPAAIIDAVANTYRGAILALAD